MNSGKAEVDETELVVSVFWRDGLRDTNITFNGDSEMIDKHCVKSNALLLDLLMKTTNTSSLIINGTSELQHVCVLI